MEVKTSGIALIEHAIALADERGMEAPEGLTWTLKSVRPDLRSRNDFRWPFPGSWAEVSNIDHENRGPCPSRNGDGLCAAKTWSGMFYGEGANTLLLVGYENERMLGADKEKLRVPRMYVRDIIDGERLVREYGAGANLAGANLERANLAEADLARANLERANLAGAYLRGAYLPGANLAGAYLRGANLRGANLAGANLVGADLPGAYLRGAYLRGANLEEANLRGARHNETTVWPFGFDVTKEVLKEVSDEGIKEAREARET